MNKIKSSLPLLLLCIATSVFGQTNLNDLYFLHGTWKAGGTYESWQWVDGQQMTGKGYEIKDGKEYLTETLALSTNGNEILYHATVLNQNDGKTIPFVLKKINARTYSFENPAHDFPTKIEYRLLSLDTIQVTLQAQNDAAPYSYRMVRQALEEAPGDLDFLIGEWKVVNKRRKKWLADNDEWIEFPATCKIKKHLKGMVVMGEFFTMRNGEQQVSSNYRIYNPDTKEWTMYWASTAFPGLGLLPQVKGGFKDGVGTFYGEEDFNGKKVKIRFLWTNTTGSVPHWEQAYFDAERNAWETNWTMDFYKI